MRACDLKFNVYNNLSTFPPCARLISERTVEENILKKANQKRLLGDIAIEGGNFTAATFKKVSRLCNFFMVSISRSVGPLSAMGSAFADLRD